MDPLNTTSVCTNNCDETSAAFPTYSKIPAAHSHVYTSSFEPLSWDPFHLHGSNDQNCSCTFSLLSEFHGSYNKLQPLLGQLTWKCCTATWLQLCISCSIWHTAPDGANGMRPKMHLPPTANLHLISFLGYHILVIFCEGKIWVFQKCKCLGAKTTLYLKHCGPSEVFMYLCISENATEFLSVSLGPWVPWALSTFSN